MKLTVWVYSIIIASLFLVACNAFDTTPPPPAVTITPSIDSGGVRVVTWTNQADELLISFYMTGARGDLVPSKGIAHLQISKPRENGCVKDAPVPEHHRLFEEFIVDGKRCLLFSVNEAAQPDDFVLEFKQYVDAVGNSREWQLGWHYWYTFVVPYDITEESLGRVVDIEVWFEHSSGYANGIWRWHARVVDGRLKEQEPFEPPTE